MDRFTWGIVAGTVLLVLLAVGGVALLQNRSGPPDLSTPEGVVRAYYLALEGNRPDEAWDLLSSTAQGQVTRADFIQRATGVRTGRGSRVTIDRVDVAGNSATVVLSETFSGGGLFGGSDSTSEVRVRLDREGGRWRITVPPQPYLINADRFAPAPAPTAAPAPAPTATPRPAA